MFFTMKKILFFLFFWPIINFGQKNYSDYIDLVAPYGFIGLAYNGYQVPANYKFLEPQEKSIAFDMNIEGSILKVIKNTLALSSGLGLEANNYRLRKDIVLVPQVDSISYAPSPYPLKKNKLTIAYLNVPLMLNLFPFGAKKKISIGFGVVGSTKIQSHTKQKLEDGSRKDLKDGFNLNPFKLEVMARIDLVYVTLFGKYSLYSMFKKDHGPDVHPLSVGIYIM